MNKKKLIIIIFIIILIVLTILDIISIPCLFHKITGLYCPGCGVTRMFLSLFKLDFYQAFRYNQFIFIMLPFGILLFIDKIIKRENSLYKKIPNYVWYIIIILLIIFGIIRNIFPSFAPTKI